MIHCNSTEKWKKSQWSFSSILIWENCVYTCHCYAPAGMVQIRRYCCNVFGGTWTNGFNAWTFLMIVVELVAPLPASASSNQEQTEESSSDKGPIFRKERSIELIISLSQCDWWFHAFCIRNLNQSGAFYFL